MIGSCSSNRNVLGEIVKTKMTLSVVLVLLVVVLAACGGSGGGAAQTDGATGGSADAGKALFAQTTIGSNAGCVTCHSLDGSSLIGPSMQGIAGRAGKEVQGQTADQYVRASIVDPNSHAPEGYTVGVMPSYKDALSDTQLNDLVAYLLTLK